MQTIRVREPIRLVNRSVCERVLVLPDSVLRQGHSLFDQVVPFRLFLPVKLEC
jgi:hypothetical protein